MHNNDTILRTKLFRPVLMADYVRRDRLIKALEKYPNRPLTLISAPAGYGKSTLAADWLERSELPCAWLSLDESDNDLRFFLLYVCCAIQGVNPNSMKKLDAALAAPALPTLEVLQQQLINGIAGIDRRFILVVDDYQLISDESIHEVVSTLIHNNIPSLHLTLLTRRDPPLPLHKFRGRGHITEIPLKDLMFTPEETREFLKRATALDIGERNATYLDAKLEGWVAGIRLVSFTLTDEKDIDHIIAGMKGSYKGVVDYLLSEVLIKQPGDIADLLVATSIFERFDEAVCVHICEANDIEVCVEGEKTGNRLISWLMTNNLFIIALDADGNWFRYHSLFRQLLLDRLEQTKGREEVNRMRRRAARYFSERGLIGEAVRLAVEGEDPALGVSIIKKNRYSLINEDRWIQLDAMMATLPRQMRIGDPDMLMTDLWTLFSRMNIPSLMDRMAKFEQFLDDDSLDDMLRGQYYFFRGYIKYFMSKGSESLADHKRAIKLIQDSSGLIRGEAELHLVLSTQMADGGDKAVDIVNDLIGRKRRIDEKHRGRLWAASSFVNLLAMDLGKAARSANEMISSSRSDKNSYVKAWGSYLSALAHFIWNDRETALELCESVVEDRFVLGMRTAADSYCLATLCLLWGGQPGRAGDVLLSLTEYADQLEDPACSQIAASFRARFALAKGDLRSARRWLRTADLDKDAYLMLWWIEIPRITGCRVLIAEGRAGGLEQAVNTLKQIIRDNEIINNSFQQVISMPLLAVALHRQGRTDEALKAMRKAISMAEPANAICPFMEFSDDTREIIDVITGDDSSTDFSKLLLDAIIMHDSISVADTLKTPGESVIVRGDFLMEGLTNRELAALRFLSEGLYYKEIAEEMSISKDTVKTHLSHVYQKLQAGSRREAVSIARELGILDKD